MYHNDSSLYTTDFEARPFFGFLLSQADDGWSGTNFNRPAFQRLLGDIESGKINLVITKDANVKLASLFAHFRVCFKSG